MANVLEVPLEGDGEVLTIDLDHDLPEDPAEICVLLENERSAVKYWLAFGSAYAAQGANNAAAEVLRQGMNAPVVESDAEKAPFYAALAWLGIRQLRSASISQRPDIVIEASKNASQALQLDKSLVTAALARGSLSLARENADEAYLAFQQLLPSQTRSAGGAGLAALAPSTNVFAALGRASVLYCRKNYRGALMAYQALLRAKPDLRPDPRIGIGLCMWQLGDRAKALAAWRRSLALSETSHDSSSAHSLIGVALLDAALHQNHDLQNFELLFREAIKHMQEAYKNAAAPSQISVPSLAIALYLLTKNELDRVMVLAEQVTKYASSSELQADAQYFRGRVFHARDDLDQALEAYKSAQAIDKSHFGAAIGRGIIELGRKSIESTFTLTDAVNFRPKNSVALLYAGIALYERAAGDKARRESAIQYLERYIAVEPENTAPEALLILARLHQHSESRPPTKALQYIQRGIATLVQSQEPNTLPAALHSNHGTLAYFCGKFDEARAAYELALQCPDAEKDLVTIQFNLARLNDANGHPEAARSGYAKVLELQPDYYDAEIRLAYLDAVLGSKELGMKSMQNLLAKHSGHAGVRSLYGWWLQRLRRQNALPKGNEDEQKLHKSTLVKLDKHDTYALCAIGNIYLVNARELRITKQADAQRRDKNYFKAAEFFNKALQVDQSNAYAAQGIAIILAETRRSVNALQIFDRLRETIDDPGVFVNTGHCHMDLKNYGLAQEAYHQALDRTPGGGDANLLTLIGRAWYAKGVTSKDLASLRAALASAREALQLQPTNAALRFNVAFLLIQIAEQVKKRTAEQRSIGEITESMENVTKAAAELREVAKGPRPPYTPSDLEKRAAQIEETLLPGLSTELAEQKEYESSLDTKLQAARRQREAELKQREAELALQAEKRREAEAALASERERLELEAREWATEREAELAEEPEPEGKPKSKKSGKSKPEKAKGPKPRRGKSVKTKIQSENISQGKKSNLSEEFINDESESEAMSSDEEERQVSENEDYDMDVDNEEEEKAESPAESAPEPAPAEVSSRRRQAVVDDDDDDDE